MINESMKSWKSKRKRITVTCTKVQTVKILQQKLVLQNGCQNRKWKHQQKNLLKSRKTLRNKKKKKKAAIMKLLVIKEIVKTKKMKKWKVKHHHLKKNKLR